MVKVKLIIMGWHNLWRKVAKKERRRRIRTSKAKQNASNYDLLNEQQLESFEIQQIKSLNAIEHKKWVEAEKIAASKWKKLQAMKELLHAKRLEQEAKLKLEWEMEQKRRAEEEKLLKEKEEENQRRQKQFMEKLGQFLSGDSSEPPAELLVSRETKPDVEPCPFFSKTACCRFGDLCSRNHQYPSISKVLLATNFFTHFGLNNANDNEYDTDLMLEYEDNDTYKEFKDFFYDVLPEFEKFGIVIQFKVCKNHEKHLRGNTYIEFSELRCAVAAYRALHTRWYGGRQLSLEFCRISSWRNAICGLQSRNRCPKGRACNFLHVFRNPDDMFNTYKSFDRSSRTPRTPPRAWRWSASPENETPRRYRRSVSSRDSQRDKVDQDSDDFNSHNKKRRLKRSSKRKSDRKEKRKTDVDEGSKVEDKEENIAKNKRRRSDKEEKRSSERGKISERVERSSDRDKSYRYRKRKGSSSPS